MAKRTTKKKPVTQRSTAPEPKAEPVRTAPSPGNRQRRQDFEDSMMQALVADWITKRGVDPSENQIAEFRQRIDRIGGILYPV